MKNPLPELTTFFYLTDPETAAIIAERGFAAAGVWSPQSTVTLLDRVPGDMGGGILRVALTAGAAREAIHNEASDPGEDYRRFLLPMELLRSAYITLQAG